MNEKVVSLHGAFKFPVDAVDLEDARTELLAVKESEAANLAEALAAIDNLRDAVASGRIKAFAAVGVDDRSVASEWRFSQSSVSDLELFGAVQLLANNIPVNRKYMT